MQGSNYPKLRQVMTFGVVVFPNKYDSFLFDVRENLMQKCFRAFCHVKDGVHVLPFMSLHTAAQDKCYKEWDTKFLHDVYPPASGSRPSPLGVQDSVSGLLTASTTETATLFKRNGRPGAAIAVDLHDIGDKRLLNLKTVYVPIGPLNKGKLEGTRGGYVPMHPISFECLYCYIFVFTCL